MNNNAISDANLYNINQWGDGYFHVNALGNIEVSMACMKGVELKAIVLAASQAGLQLPLLIRFTDILHDRVFRLYEAFAQAREDSAYSGTYTLVFPIKVNQEYCVVRELLNAPGHQIGLEAGSKPELMAVIGLLGERKSVIVCNGYKDATYVRAALIAQQMGHDVFIIIEKRSELDIILREAKRLEVKPRIGVRIRLVTTCAGKWTDTGGTKSKFGLNAEQILDVVHQLKKQNALDCLELMHCHLGSQLANIQDIRSCMEEVARYYVALRNLNVPIGTIDVGGGLGVDYEGTHSNTDCSVNYNLHEYATQILLAMREVCRDTQWPEPNIISESGRALTAHHAVLVTNITDIEVMKHNPPPRRIQSADSPIAHDISAAYQSMADHSSIDVYHSAEHALNQAHALFKQGVISLTEKAAVEEGYAAICLKLQQRMLEEAHPDDATLLDQLNERLATKIFCNLSFFQSIPDAWAIGQIFPIAPLSHLTEKPNMQSILQDLTCDSDGTLRQYIGETCIKKTLLLPSFDEKRPYDLAFFLVGAYQEILGNLHNLFGDTNAIRVQLNAGGRFEIDALVKGDAVTDVLRCAHIDSEKLLVSYEKQLKNNNLPQEKADLYLNELRDILTQSTYLDDNKYVNTHPSSAARITPVSSATLNNTQPVTAE